MTGNNDGAVQILKDAQAIENIGRGYKKYNDIVSAQDKELRVSNPQGKTEDNEVYSARIEEQLSKRIRSIFMVSMADKAVTISF